MPVNEGEPAFIAWPSSPFVPILERALRDPSIFVELGKCTVGEFGLAEEVQYWRDLFGVVDPMWALHNPAEGGDPGSHRDK
jgi:hypothetical protein